MILVVDNHDSFTFNLVHYCIEAGAEVVVARADALSVAEAMETGRDGILISPGPGRPEDAGISVALAEACVAVRRPLLGVCLGHQAIAVALGGRVVRAPRPMHGKTSAIEHDGSGVFAGLPSPFTATRYHSLMVDSATLPADLIVSARADDETVQGLRHRELEIHGVQFHPESIASEQGHALLGNFVAMTKARETG